MGRRKGSKNKPKSEHVQYEFKEVLEPPQIQEREEMNTQEITKTVVIPTTALPPMLIAESIVPQVQVTLNQNQEPTPTPTPVGSTTALLEKAAPAPLIRELTAIEKQRIEDEKLVKGTFVYRAKPGGRYQTVLRKYKKDPNAKNAQGFHKINMIDGQSYTVPKWIADWLNGEKEHSCCDWKHNADNINLIEEARKPAERVPVFRFIIQDYAA